MKTWLKLIITFSVICLLYIGFITYKIEKHKESTANGTYETIIILGAKVKPDRSLSVSLKNRLDAALEYIENNKQYNIIVTGGQGVDEPISEAQAMHDYLVEHGIDSTRIIIEDESTSTYQNLLNAKALCNGELTEATIVSSDFHLARATFLANQLNIKNDTIAAATPPSVYTKSMIREHLALMKTYIFRK